MTTATVTTRPPTEAEIRQAIDAEFADHEEGVFEDAFLVDIACALGRFRHHVWETKEFRPSEEDDQSELFDQASDRWYAAALPLLIKELTAAGVAFAAKHPDAPRAS